MEPELKKRKLDEINKLVQETTNNVQNALRTMSSRINSILEGTDMPVASSSVSAPAAAAVTAYPRYPYPNRDIVLHDHLPPYDKFGKPLQSGTLATVMEYCVSKAKCYAHKDYHTSQICINVAGLVAGICKALDPPLQAKTVTTKKKKKHKTMRYRIPEDVPILDLATSLFENGCKTHHVHFDIAVEKLRSELPGWRRGGGD